MLLHCAINSAYDFLENKFVCTICAMDMNDQTLVRYKCTLITILSNPNDIFAWWRIQWVKKYIEGYSG